MIEIILPASKSISNRALIIQAVNPSVKIANLSRAQDTIYLQKALTQLHKGAQEIYTGDGGTTFRFFLAYAATRKKGITLQGSERLNQRPIQPLLEALEKAGAKFRYWHQNYRPPLTIEQTADLQVSQIETDASESSQFLSSLLLVAPLFKKGLSIQTGKNIASSSYVKITIELMKYFGVEVKKHHDEWQIAAKPYKSKSIVIENDWSSASYWWIVAWLMPKQTFRLKNLSLNSLQPDKAIVEILKDFISVCQDNHDILIRRKENPPQTPIYRRLNCEQCPDIIPTLVVFSALANMRCKICGTHTLYKKESNRVEALKNELRKIQVELKELSCNEIEVIPNEQIPLIHNLIQTYDDHRIAMAFAPLKIIFPGLEVENPETVNKSYPEFWQELKKVLNA